MVNTEKIALNTEALSENIAFINASMAAHCMTWTLITKGFKGRVLDQVFDTLCTLPLLSIGSDDLQHLSFVKARNPRIETWFLNYDACSEIPHFVDVNLSHAWHQNHPCCTMLCIDPERKGIALEKLPALGPAQRVGAYLDCKTMPEADFFKTWKNLGIPSTTLQSLGTSVSFPALPFLQDCGVTHYRIGEMAFFGRNLVTGAKVRGMRSDVFIAKRKITYDHLSTLILQPNENHY